MSLSLSTSVAKDIVYASLLIYVVIGVRYESAIHLNLLSIES